MVSIEKEIMLNHYILDKKGIPIIEKNLRKWTEWYEKSFQKLNIIKTEFKEEGIVVSTIFLAIDCSFGQRKPMLYETVVFPTSVGVMKRYHTKKEAIKGHKSIVKGLKDKIKRNEK